MLPKFTVVIPTFNRAEFLPRTVTSVLDQNRGDVEIIVVDDGSTDDTADLVNRFTVKGGQVSYFHQQNSGRSVARNNGIAQSKGEWFIFLDSDDLMADGALNIFSEEIKRFPEISIIAGRTSTIDEDDRQIEVITVKPKDNKYLGLIRSPYPKLIRDFYLSMGSYAVKRDVVEKVIGFRPELEPCEDFDFCLRAASHTDVFRVDKEVLKIRKHGSNTPNSQFYLSGIKVAEEHLKQLYEYAPGAESTVRSLWQHNIADDYFHLGKHSKAFGHYLDAVKTDRSRLKDSQLRRQLLSCLTPTSLKNRLKRRVLKG